MLWGSNVQFKPFTAAGGVVVDFFDEGGCAGWVAGGRYDVVATSEEEADEREAEAGGRACYEEGVERHGVVELS